MVAKAAPYIRDHTVGELVEVPQVGLVISIITIKGGTHIAHVAVTEFRDDRRNCLMEYCVEDKVSVTPSRSSSTSPP